MRSGAGALPALNCIQLQASCKMCTQVSGRYLIAAAQDADAGASASATDAARNGPECQTNSYLMYELEPETEPEPAARDVQRKCQMRCLSIFWGKGRRESKLRVKVDMRRREEVPRIL